VTSVPDAELEALVAKGFSVEHATTPRELCEPHPIAPPWTWDDLLSAHELLDRTPLIVALVQKSGS